MLDSAGHIDALSEERHILEPHSLDALRGDSYMLKPHELSDVG
ncbi:unnamed protein product [Ectocarpus sp. CCAP 1310/34]|nr:unnamed protein product [Ectocarpus sp. CCAP 1310/34]